MFKTNRAFTLIELLVVISIISMLSSIIYSSVSKARENARLAAGMESNANILHGIGDQLVGEWKFNEGPTSAVDTSSFKRNGVYNSFSWPTWSATGGYDGKASYYFNGSKNIQTGFNFKILKSINWTFSAWIKTSNQTSSRAILGATGGKNFYFGSNNGYFRAVVGGYCIDKTFTNIYLADGKWHHIALENAKGKLNIYLDGTYRDSVSITCLGSQEIDYPMYIGGRNSDDFWVGDIDEVRVYTSAFSI